MSVRFLVTGGAGFIGSNLVELLLGRGYAVRVLDNFSTGHRQNLLGLRGDLDVMEGDVREPQDCERALQGITHVVHLAAEVSVARSIESPLETNAINVGGTCQVLEASKKAGVKGFVLASTCAVYGDAQTLPVAENTPPRPLSPYATSKLAAEEYSRLYRRLYDLPTVVFRLFNVYGPKQDPKSPYSGVISAFAHRLSQGVPTIIFGDGEQTRDFIFVKDVASAFLWAAMNAGELHEPAYNLASGSATSVKRLHEIIASLYGRQASPAFAPPRSGEVRHSVGSASLFRRHAGFSPLPLQRGLEVTVGSYR